MVDVSKYLDFIKAIETSLADKSYSLDMLYSIKQNKSEIEDILSLFHIYKKIKWSGTQV